MANYSGHITLSKDGFGFRTDCALHLDSGITLEADSNASDAYSSADQALLMIEKRLRRYKSRLKDRSARKAHAASEALAGMDAQTLDAPSYVIEAPAEGDDEVAGYSPVIIAEATTSLKRLSVSEAVMELDLSGGRLSGVPARFKRPGEHHLPPPGRQCRLDRSPCGELRGLERFRAKHALGLDPRVDTGSRKETRQNKRLELRFGFNRNRSGSGVPSALTPGRTLPMVPRP